MVPRHAGLPCLGGRDQSKVALRSVYASRGLEKPKKVEWCIYGEPRKKRYFLGVPIIPE